MALPCSIGPCTASTHRDQSSKWPLAPTTWKKSFLELAFHWKSIVALNTAPQMAKALSATMSITLIKLVVPAGQGLDPLI